MLYDSYISIAIKNEQGQYITRQCTAFELDKALLSITSLKIKTRRQREIMFSLRCPLCGDIHDYHIHIADVVRKDMVIGGCEATGMPVFFIGNSEKVREHIQKHNEISKQFYAIMGVK